MSAWMPSTSRPAAVSSSFSETETSVTPQRRSTARMATWSSMLRASRPIEAQENAIGRTKRTDIEMPDNVKPSNAHIALNVVTDSHSNELKILRDNMLFGSLALSEFGTYCIAYAKTPRIIEKMLDNMFI